MESVLIATDNKGIGSDVQKSLVACLGKDMDAVLCSMSEASKKAQEKKPSALLIDVQNLSSAALPFIEANASSPNPLRIVGLGEPSDVGLVMKLIRLGVKDYLHYPVSEEEIRNIFHAASNVKMMPEKDGCKIITFYGPKGGSGVTFLAMNVGVALAKKHNAKVVLCDFSYQCGDIATYLNLEPAYTLRDIADNDHLLDSSFVEGTMVQHKSGVRVIAGPRENQEPLNQDHVHVLKSLIQVLRSSCDYLVLDGGRTNPALLQYLMSESTGLFLIGNPDVASFKGLISVYNKLRGLHYPTEKISIVMNRHNSKNHIETKVFEKATRHPIDFYIPNNFSLCIEAVNTGQSVFEIDSKSDLAGKISDMARFIAKTDHAQQMQSARG